MIVTLGGTEMDDGYIRWIIVESVIENQIGTHPCIYLKDNKLLEFFFFFLHFFVEVENKHLLIIRLTIYNPLRMWQNY